jgi:hypothetical protein
MVALAITYPAIVLAVLAVAALAVAGRRYHHSWHDDRFHYDGRREGTDEGPLPDAPDTNPDRS